MKVRISLLHEDDIPSSVIGATKEEQEDQIKKAWEIVMAHLQIMQNDPSVKVSVESVEVLE